jgi:nucleotide-binding universal stress UspA family protein
VHGNEPLRQSGTDSKLDHPVVVGYDGSPSSRNALAYGAGVALRLSRPLVIVHVTPGVYCEPLTGQVIGAPRARSETERWVRSELAEVCDCDGVDVRVIMRHGNAARELSTAADELSADALVIGAPRQKWHQVAGSVPGWLARHARCPVIVVP